MTVLDRTVEIVPKSLHAMQILCGCHTVNYFEWVVAFKQNQLYIFGESSNFCVRRYVCSKKPLSPGSKVKCEKTIDYLHLRFASFVSTVASSHREFSQLVCSCVCVLANGHRSFTALVVATAHRSSECSNDCQIFCTRCKAEQRADLIFDVSRSHFEITSATSCGRHLQYQTLTRVQGRLTETVPATWRITDTSHFLFSAITLHDHTIFLALRSICLCTITFELFEELYVWPTRK
mmetsp:Transcript_39328/g.62314  ORF Transcript_39328/g.62314 Transcript_39328/m.62314 type:complete len:235 (+) Transcript_39328:1404-2108(+)